MTLAKSERPFLPAAGHDWFLPLYDPLTRLLGVGTAHRALLDQAALEPHHRVLDVGCGTGSLAVLIKQRHPTVSVIGLDPDPKALARAGRKARRAGLAIRFDQGFADALAYPDGSFDRVFSSMMFHHLADGDREKMLREVRRVLKPGGRLEFLDFAGPASSGHGPLGRLVHSHHRLKDNADSRILELLTRGGFWNLRKVREQRAAFGRLTFFQAAAPTVVS
jgi:ubiquinone/menaquinone biosynthesis C-methylase UbiE